MDNLEEQKEELICVESIFNAYENNLTFDEKHVPCGHFKASVRLPENFNITYSTPKSSQNSTAASEASKVECFEVKYLPHINIFFELPSTYPTETCPAFLISCNWLTLKQISILCKHLESMWDEGIPVLYIWFQFLENDIIEYLNIQNLDITELLTYKVNNFRSHMETFISADSVVDAASNKNSTIQSSDQCSSVIKPSIKGGNGPVDCRALNELNDGRSLIQLLRNYNEFKISEVFNRTYHECDICMTSKMGKDFVMFKPCKHFYCIECLRSFFEIHIQEGNVNCLTCPYEKCISQADGSLVRQLVDKDLFERYDSILLSRTLETMEDVTYCPRKWCQCAVVIDPGERMGSCPSCTFVFCPYCKMAYHGVAPCSFKSEEKQSLFEQYMKGDSEVKEALEKRHGKRVMKALVEDILSEDWKNHNSKTCPECHSRIQKTDGCNKMTCFKCGTFFCWLCNGKLDHSNPYRHFSNQGGKCILFPEDVMNDMLQIGPGDLLNYY